MEIIVIKFWNTNKNFEIIQKLFYNKKVYNKNLKINNNNKYYNRCSFTKDFIFKQ